MRIASISVVMEGDRSGAQRSLAPSEPGPGRRPFPNHDPLDERSYRAGTITSDQWVTSLSGVQPCPVPSSSPPPAPPSASSPARSPSFSAMDLGGVAIKAALERGGVEPDQVDYVIMGQVLQAGQGQITARQAAVKGGIPMTVPAITINKVCLSGINAIYLADQMIQAGDAEVVVAGGMESMTNAPYLLPKARAGYRMGNGELVDSMIHDGLWCAFDAMHMGAGTENYTEQVGGITRELQDEFAAKSHERAAAGDEGRPLRRRDRAGRDPAAQGRPGPGRRRRGRPARHDRRVARQAPPRVHEGRHDHRRQRVADLRRCRGDDRHEPGEGRRARPHAARRARRLRHGRRPRHVAAHPAVACDQAGARRREPPARVGRPLRAQRGVRRCRDSRDAATSASPTTSSTSTAARSRSATRSACPVPAS